MASRYKTKYEKSWAVVVGINEYAHASKLGYARNDAAEFASMLTKDFGFPAENVTTLLDGDATRASIQSAMHKLIPATGVDDRVIVFYAGHGHTLEAYGREAGFMVPVDGNPTDTSTLIPWDDLYNTSRIAAAKHFLFIMDACYGGLIGMRGATPGTARFARDMLSRYARQFLTAGKANEKVADAGGPRPGHSVFTGHLLDALEGGMSASDGIVSANSLMAHVYSRVAKDPHSFQAPHFGFLAGDGDLLFKTPPDDPDPGSPTPTEGPMMVVPADLDAPKEVIAPPPLLEQVKQYLSDRAYRIQLNDLVRRELRAAQQRLGERDFPVQGSGITVEDFADRLIKYEQAMGQLLGVCVLLGHWAEAEQLGVIRQVVNVLAGQIEEKSGLVQWLRLRSFPMLLAMYAGGIAAVEGENYASLRALLTTEVPKHNEHAKTTVLQATMEAMWRVQGFSKLPGHERNYTPLSEYMFARVQPIVEDPLFLGKRYEHQFDRYELLSALSYVHLSGGDIGPIGRFGWKHGSRGMTDDPFSAIVEEAKRQGDNWPPLRAGMFDGSSTEFAEAAKRMGDRISAKSWH